MPLRMLVMLACAGVLAAAAPHAQQSPQQPAPPAASFRVGVDVVSLNVTVTDRANRYVLDLDLPDFSVFEDGAKQDVAFFTRQRQSVALSLLLDSSASMEDHLSTLQTAATSFVQRLGPNDVAQVIDFDSRVVVRQSFTGDHGGARGRDSTDDSRRLHLALQRDLRRAERVG